MLVEFISKHINSFLLNFMVGTFTLIYFILACVFQPSTLGIPVYPKVFLTRPAKLQIGVLYAVFLHTVQPQQYGIHSDKGELILKDPPWFSPSELPRLFPRVMPDPALCVYGASWKADNHKRSVYLQGTQIIVSNARNLPKQVFDLKPRLSEKECATLVEEIIRLLRVGERQSRQ